MFAKYLKQLNKVAFYRPPARNISFLKNLIKKDQPTPEQTPQEKTTINQDFPNLQENQKFEQEKQETAEFNEREAFEYEHEQELTSHLAESTYESGFPPAPKSRSTELQEEVDKELDLPYKLYGSQVQITPRTGYMIDRIFAFHKIPRDFVTNHLNKIYTGVLYSIAARDEEFLNEYLEKHFCERLLKNLTELSKKGYMLQVVTDMSGRKGEVVAPKIDVMDMIMVKGLNTDRDANRDENAYHKYVDIEDMGLVIYTPLEVTDPNNFIDPKKNQAMYDDHAKVIGRLLVEVQSPLKLVIVRPNGEEIAVDNEFNSFKHTAVFETQMKAPPKFTSANKMENYMEWLGKFKFGSWKMADLDNWMLGNPLILNQTAREKYKDEVFKGSKYDVESTIDLKKV